jgi:hypothetical protein
MTPTDRYLNEHRVRMARAARKRDRRMHRIARRWKGCTWHKRHGTFVGRYKYMQQTYSVGEFKWAAEAAYMRDCLAWTLTGGTVPRSALNFPDLFPPLEASA